MDARHETRLTVALCGACLLLLGVGAWPHLTVRRVPVVPTSPDLTVSVAGAVRAPGSYVLPWGSRVEQLLEAAGGLTPAAEPTLINPADPLSEGEAVVVPSARTDDGHERVSLNAADPDELQSLPGIGPALAARIVAARPFRRLEDLLSVRGIGPATLQRLRPSVGL